MEKLPSYTALLRLSSIDKNQSGSWDALVWYAWRSALRVSPLLGSTPIKRVWPKDTTRHVFSVVSSYIILAQWLSPSTYNFAEIDDALYEAENAKDRFLRDSSTRGFDSALSSISEAARTYSFANSLEAANDAAIFASDIEVTASSIFSDYKLLQEQLRHKLDLTEEFWFSQPLWNKGPLDNHSEAEKIALCGDNFLLELKALGLDFLANDLQRLWESKPLGKHAKNYLRPLSAAITNDPVALRAAITGGVSSQETIQNVRILLLGPGGAGKTSLRDRLLGKAKEESLNRDPTIGVEYEALDQNQLRSINPELQKSEILQLRLWDFGGQTIFHGLHRAFLHENCVYVLVVDSRHEQAPDEWLYQIRDLTRAKPKVLLVTNLYENCKTQQNQSRLMREFPDLIHDTKQFYYFSCHDRFSSELKRFAQALVDQGLESQHSVLKLAMNVYRQMRKSFADDVFMQEKRILDLIPEHLASVYSKTVINHLDQLGCIIRVKKKHTRFCLNPEWAIQNAYRLVHSPRLRSEEQGGLADLSDLQSILDGSADLDQVEYLIQLLESRYLCRELNDGRYFFPDAAPADEPKSFTRILDRKHRLTLRFDLPFLPLNLHACFIHALFEKATSAGMLSTDSIWRQGFIMKSGSAEAAVNYQWRKSNIEVHISGTDYNDVSVFAQLLMAFDDALEAVLNESCLDRSDVQPFVVYGEGKHVYSIHSSGQLADKLREITHIDQLYPEVANMASESVVNNINIEKIEGANVAVGSEGFTQNSHNQNLEVSADQRKQMAIIVSELLNKAADLESSEVIATGKVKEALEAPENNKEANQILGKVWTGVREVGGFAKEMVPVGEFVIKNKEVLKALAGALKDAVS